MSKEISLREDDNINFSKEQLCLFNINNLF